MALGLVDGLFQSGQLFIELALLSQGAAQVDTQALVVWSSWLIWRRRHVCSAILRHLVALDSNVLYCTRYSDDDSASRIFTTVLFL